MESNMAIDKYGLPLVWTAAYRRSIAAAHHLKPVEHYDAVAAYDAAEGLQPTGEVTPAKQVYAKLVASLSPKDVRELRELLQTESIDEYPPVDQPEGANDEPPDFPGKPLIAQDRALRRPYDGALRASQRIRVI
jgi:hypothetical protein